MRSPRFIIGFAAGWFAGRLVAGQRPAALAQQEIQWALDGCRQSLADRTAEVEQLEAQLESAQVELAALKSRLATEPPAALPALLVEDIKPAPVRDDDLTTIEGIGPKIAALLIDHGICSFAGLAAADIARLHEILHAGGTRFRMANPESWPLQARLAANGAWDELTVLQGRLKAGTES